jgi:hypothetical protein
MSYSILFPVRLGDKVTYQISENTTLLGTVVGRSVYDTKDKVVCNVVVNFFEEEAEKSKTVIFTNDETQIEKPLFIHLKKQEKC